MKELSIEEKAKAYDVAVINGSRLWECGEITRENYEYIFPELKESEDERIRKALIRYFTLSDEHAYYEACGVSYRDIVAWLEKQDEHKKFRDSIQVGDKVTRNQDGMLVNLSQLKRIAKPNETKQGEQKPAWSEEDDRMMNDTLAVIDWYAGKHKNISVKLSNWLKSIKNRVQPKQEWSEEDEANLDYFIDFCNGYYNGNKPVLTESTARSLSNWLCRLKSCEIMSKTNKIDNKEAEKTIHLACEFIRHRMESNGNIGGVDYAELIKRLKSLKDRVQLQPKQEWKQENTGVPKQEWSEEDETYLDHIITAIKSYYTDDKGKENPWREELLRWLESLKDRYTWKPSDEQMKALNEAIYHVDDSVATQIAMLIGELSKL